MLSTEQFLDDIQDLENELRKHLEFSELDYDKEVRELLAKYLKEVREIKATMRDDSAGLN